MHPGCYINGWRDGASWQTRDSLEICQRMPNFSKADYEAGFLTGRAAFHEMLAYAMPATEPEIAEYQQDTRDSNFGTYAVGGAA